MNNDTVQQWFALYTKSRAEKKVCKALRQKGMVVYLPMRKELRQWSDRKKWIEIPIINSYIFVQIPKNDYHKVFEAQGVISYVSQNGKAVSIPNREIEAMQRTVASNLSFDVEESTIRKGQVVTITSGPLKGIRGEVVDLQSSRKLYLRISHIGYTLVVNLENESS